jgi:hypothetical protein
MRTAAFLLLLLLANGASASDHWTYPGHTSRDPEMALRLHLATTHDIDVSYMTFSEMLNMHDSHHESGFVPTKSSAPVVQQRTVEKPIRFRIFRRRR